MRLVGCLGVGRGIGFREGLGREWGKGMGGVYDMIRW